MPSLAEATAELEVRRSRSSFRYFFAHYWKVPIPGRGRVLVDPRPEQLESAETFQENRRIVVLKARQIGWSTLVAAYVFWVSWFNPDKICMVLSKREDPEARLIVSMIKFGHGQLPVWLKNRGPAMLNNNMNDIKWSNGSVVESDASKDDPARGRTLDLLVMDEFGKFVNPDNAWGSALPATEYGQLIVIGNANGYKTRFHNLYAEAKEGLNDFVARFYPWNVVAHRDEAWLKKETSSMTPAERAAEYPANDEECWVAAGSPVFDIDVIRSWKTSKPQRGMLLDGKFYESEDGPLRVWIPPVPGLRYVAGIDTAEGLEHGDNSVVMVFDITGRHSATLSGKYDPTEIGIMGAQLCRWYNEAFVGVETNRGGFGTIRAMIDSARYPTGQIYRRKVFNERTLRVTEVYGFDTNVKTKPMMISMLWQRLHGGEVTSPSSEFAEEMAGYKHVGNGTMAGSPHDDQVMGAALAVQMLVEVEPTWRPPPPPPDPENDSPFEFDGTVAGYVAAFGPKTPPVKTRFAMNRGFR